MRESDRGVEKKAVFQIKNVYIENFELEAWGHAGIRV